MNQPQYDVTSFIVNQPNPDLVAQKGLRQHVAYKQAVQPRLVRGGNLHLHLFLPQPQLAEINLFHGQGGVPTTLHLMGFEGLLMGLLEFGSQLQFEFSYNARALQVEEAELDFLAAQITSDKVAYITLTCSETFLVRGLRRVKLSQKVAHFFQMEAKNQLAQGTLSPIQAEKVIQRFAQQHPDFDAVKKVSAVSQTLLDLNMVENPRGPKI